ncbi:MAG: ABC transporter permease, partial [Anaerolineae bacterium]|nr:ABC transporter permease [Anaerolineae bacterium]
ALQFLRYRLLLIFVVAFPIWNLTSVAQMVSRGIMHIPTAVYDQNQSRTSRELVTMLTNSDVFEVNDYASNQAELNELLERGTAKVGLIIPPTFSRDVERQTATVQVLLDGSETSTALIAQAYLEGMAYVYVQRVLAGATVLPGELAQIDTRARTWFNEDMRREVFQLPGEMAGGLAMLSVLLPALAIIKEREEGTLEQLFVTPLRSFELVIGKSLLTLVIAYLAFLGMLSLNVLHFAVPLRGSLALLLVLTGLYIFVEMGWGLLISATARTQGQGFLGAFIIVILEVILSGQVLPVEYMPRAAQVIGYLMPNRHYTTIVRNIMLKGSTLADLWPQLIALGVVGLVLYMLAVNRLQKRLE